MGAAPLVLELGAGQYQIGARHSETPPQLHFYAHPHDMRIGADVLARAEAPDEAIVATLVFHKRDAVDAMLRALGRLRDWFPDEVGPRLVL